MCDRWNTRPICLSFPQFCNLRTGSTKIPNNDRFCVIINTTVLISLAPSNEFNTYPHSSNISAHSLRPLTTIACYAMRHIYSFYRLCLLLTFDTIKRSSDRTLSPNHHTVNAFRSFTDVVHSRHTMPALCRLPSLQHAYRQSSCPPLSVSYLDWIHTVNDVRSFTAVHLYSR